MAACVSMIQVKKDVLGAELKMLREEGHRASLELGERQQSAQKLAGKHAMLCSQIVGADGFDCAEERSQARSRALLAACSGTGCSLSTFAMHVLLFIAPW